MEALVAHISWCPPANVWGLPVTPSSPNPAHHAKAGQCTLEEGEKEQEEDLHPGQLYLGLAFKATAEPERVQREGAT